MLNFQRLKIQRLKEKYEEIERSFKESNAIVLKALTDPETGCRLEYDDTLVYPRHSKDHRESFLIGKVKFKGHNWIEICHSFALKQTFFRYNYKTEANIADALLLAEKKWWQFWI